MISNNKENYEAETPAWALKVMADYTESCKQKKSFAQDYIKKNQVNCPQCKEEECTFITPPYYCNVALVEINELLPVSINKLENEIKSVDEILGI